MAEMDTFERRVVDTLDWYAEDVSLTVDATVVAHRVALEHPRSRARVRAWVPVAVPRLAWVLLLMAALLVSLVGGVLVAGSQLQRFLPAVVPPIGQLYECPPGSNPDEPGPVDQARPAYFSGERITFDRRAGRLVAVTSADGLAPETWTFDLCTNTWTKMHPDQELPDFVAGQLVYDVHADATIGIVNGPDGALPGRVWAYDLDANTWIQKGLAPSGVAIGAYDPVSGRVAAANTLVDAIDLWTYDVETDTWTQVRQANGPPCEYWASAYDASVDRWVTYREAGWGKEKAMCLIDIRSATWSGTRAVTPPEFSTGFYLLIPSVVYDETTERTVFSDGRRLAAYDATADRWETLVEADPSVGLPRLMAYDPLHRRLVGVGQGEDRPDVAFDPVARTWTVLLDRDPTAGPWPPTPAPTLLEPGETQPADTPAPASAPTSAPTAAPPAGTGGPGLTSPAPIEPSAAAPKLTPTP
jgi:hypothetical protein